jgi:fumarate hydratase class I
MLRLTTPISAEQIRSLHVGDSVLLSGIIITGRDAAHKYMIEHFIRQQSDDPDDVALLAKLRQLLDGGVIYHCGPVVKKHDDGSWSFVAAGPTTSIREEVYEAEVIKFFNLKGVIGKGGMAGKTLQACHDQPAVYFHAIGGAATLIAQSVKEVVDVYKLDFGVPEAMWVIRVEDFPVVVTMDSHGQSIHDKVLAESTERFKALVG